MTETYSPLRSAAMAVTDPRMLGPDGLIRRPAGTVPYADTARHVCIFGVPSSDGTKLYKISYDTAMDCWVCECKGGIHYGKCKHMDAYGLMGWKAMADLGEREQRAQDRRAEYRRLGRAPVVLLRNAFVGGITYKAGDVLPTQAPEREVYGLLAMGYAKLEPQAPAQPQTVGGAGSGRPPAPKVPQGGAQVPKTAPQGFAPAPAGAPVPKLAAAMLAPPARRFGREGQA